MNAKTLFIELQSEHCMKTVTSLFLKVCPFDIYLNTCSWQCWSKNPAISQMKPKIQ